MRADDGEGLKAISTCLADSQLIEVEEAAAIQGVRPRSVEAHLSTRAGTGNSANLMDRRHFNGGQRTDYRMGPHKAELIRCATLNLVQGQRNSERGLAAQLGHVVDDRAVGRHLNAMGWRAADYLDDYVNAIFRREAIARTKHGTRYGICKPSVAT